MLGTRANRLGIFAFRFRSPTHQGMIHGLLSLDCQNEKDRKSYLQCFGDNKTQRIL